MTDSLFKNTEEDHSPKRSWMSSWVMVFLVFLLLACGVGVFFVGNVLYDYIADNQKMISSLRDSEQSNYKFLRDLSNRFGDIESQFKDLRSRYEQSAEFLNRYSGVHSTQILVQIREYVGVSFSNLMWLGNPSEALSLLSAAHNLAMGVESPDFSRLANLINTKVEKLKELHLEMNNDFSSQMTYFEDVLSSMNFAGGLSESKPRIGNFSDDSLSEKNSFWESFWTQLQKRLRDFVRIDHDNRPSWALLTPEEKDFVKQVIHLHTLSLRLSWIVHDKIAYDASLGKISALMDRYFYHDDNYKKSKDMIDNLAKINFVSLEVIDMSDIERCIDEIQNKQRNLFATAATGKSEV